jgi:PAS domain-containing protein
MAHENAVVTGTPAPAGPCESDIQTDVSMLIRALRETDRQLEELTRGEVDTVTDRDGRSYLLQRAQERWRQTGLDRQSAILDALQARIVLLDRDGRILATNESRPESVRTI